MLAAKLVPLAYGIKKLQIACVVEDEKVSSYHFFNYIFYINKVVVIIIIASDVLEHKW